MIYLIHGQNQVDSRRFLIRLRSNYKNIRVIPGKNLNDKDFLKLIKEYNQPLFEGREAILIEEFDGNWDILPKQEIKGIDIILWADRKIDKLVPKTKTFLFEQQKKLSAFKLVDAVLYKDEKEALVILDTLLKKKEPGEKIIGAFLRGFGLLYCAKTGSLEKAKIPLFASERIKEQEKNWNKAEIKRALLNLIYADVTVKGGQNASIALTTFINRVT
ncbi:MAG: hypothetical protein A2172_01105 [Candidatus Woykebacteria bacterium RBG_13_40_15]|uniref:DNA-directed DNA polymerase n=1 Tax=Candidatus Woykebacteria bacterium RBG_13_40_15 TaxID=1802593 RepID=A0A1G1W8Y0_9BACT|nr:MAG: hypothetical protein A2172_01105 [Candidatus Woykebacteria bacterium RBG_13_40_15]